MFVVGQVCLLQGVGSEFPWHAAMYSPELTNCLNVRWSRGAFWKLFLPPVRGLRAGGCRNYFSEVEFELLGAAPS